MSCSHDCRKGRDCNCTAAAEAEGVFPMPTGCSTKAAPRLRTEPRFTAQGMLLGASVAALALAGAAYQIWRSL